MDLPANRGSSSSSSVAAGNIWIFHRHYSDSSWVLVPSRPTLGKPIMSSASTSAPVMSQFSLLDEASTHLQWKPYLNSWPIAHSISSSPTSGCCSRPASFLCRFQEAAFSDSWRPRRHRRQTVCPLKRIFMKVTPVNICTRQLLTGKKRKEKSSLALRRARREASLRSISRRWGWVAWCESFLKASLWNVSQSEGEAKKCQWQVWRR